MNMNINGYSLCNTGINIEKKDASGMIGQLYELSSFTANEDAIYKLETFIYRQYGVTGDLPADYVSVSVYRSKNSQHIEFDKQYTLVKVYNTVFNKEELEPIENKSSR